METISSLKERTSLLGEHVVFTSIGKVVAMHHCMTKEQTADLLSPYDDTLRYIHDFALEVCLDDVTDGRYTGLLKQMKHDMLYLEMAAVVGKFTYCRRKNVGCVIVRDRQIVSHGYNGTLPGMPNVCEDEDTGETLPSVVHAEKNAIAKLAKAGNSGDGASAYITLSPCVDCATLLVSSGIKKIVYKDMHSSINDLSIINDLDITMVTYPNDIRDFPWMSDI